VEIFNTTVPSATTSHNISLANQTPNTSSPQIGNITVMEGTYQYANLCNYRRITFLPALVVKKSSELS